MTATARAGVDVGGTFTDVVLRRGDGSVQVRKVLSTPPVYDRAVVDAVATLASTEGELAEIVHGTTVATNAVLERRGSLTALVTTAGFRDVLELRRLRLPHMYDLFWRKPPPLVPRRLRFELGERVTADGTVLRALDEDEARVLGRLLASLGIESVAICFLHSYLHPAHERRAGEILAAEHPTATISLSSEILREQREYERSATTVVNAYVRPLMGSYIDRIRTRLDGLGVDAPLQIMQSSGGVMTSDDAKLRPVYALESGPAAGVVAALGMAQLLGVANAIAFDMGGTTAKASLIEDGAITRGREYEVGGSLSAGNRLMRGAGELLRIPTIDIAEVGAGGGSLAWLDPAGGLQVGPRSAGADPGPACYGLGGIEPTVTDANVVLGLMPDGAVADGEITISRARAEEAVRRVAGPLALSVEETAEGIHRIANARMTRALRSVSSEKGRDPRELALIAYGGAGPLHAAALAGGLGMRTVVVPPAAGLFSAVGLLFARPEFHDVRTCHLDAGTVDPGALAGLYDDMMAPLAAALAGRGEVTWVRTADLRYGGQSWEVEVELPSWPLDADVLTALRERFEEEHQRLYGVRGQPGSPVDIRAVRLAGLGPSPSVDTFSLDHGRVAAGRARTRGGRQVATREEIGEAPVSGPLLVDEYDTTVVVPADWTVRRDARTQALVLERVDDENSSQGDASPAGRAGRVRCEDAGSPNTRRIGATEDAAARRPDRHGGTRLHPEMSSKTRVDPITLQVVANALASIADEMATTIFRTAHSTVVRDGMDFSAALLDARGETVAQAVSVPFHLGSIPVAMERLLDRYDGRMAPGDVFLMNDPFDGGIHLQDLFVFKPVHLDGEVLGFTATTAHHGDVGGRLPGSSACDNTEIFQEGIRLPWLKLYDAGRPVEDVFKIVEANVRIPRMTLGDLGAQVAACTVAERALRALAERHGAAELAALMDALVEHTERLVRSEIATWPDGTATFTDYLGSDGIEERDVPIVATVTIAGDEVTADLTESAPMVRGSLNSTRSFVQACVYQAVRSALEVDVPNTSGAFRPIHVLTKPGTVAEVVMPGASSMRGVTGFRVLDAVNGALAQLVPDRVPAAGEGGNTLAIFGADRPEGGRFVFYELVVGTWGATPVGDGNDGLTNPASLAANIPVEVAESEFPIHIERYGLVPDTGGPGLHRGGLAVERVWRCLTPETSLIVRSDRATHPPYGLAGGQPGAPSSNVLCHPDGTEELLPSMFSTTIGAGDLYVHRMAGGGGWGDPLARDPADVTADVIDGKVSTAAAEAGYGVVVGVDGIVDERATDTLRASRRSA